MHWIYKKLFPVENVHRNHTKIFHYLVNCYGFFNSLICETMKFLLTDKCPIYTRLKSLFCDVTCQARVTMSRSCDGLRSGVTCVLPRSRLRQNWARPIVSLTAAGRAGADPSEPGGAARSQWTVSVIRIYRYTQPITIIMCHRSDIRAYLSYSEEASNADLCRHLQYLVFLESSELCIGWWQV